MTTRELMGKHKRLRQELSAAAARPGGDPAHLQRLTGELVAIERLLAPGAREDGTALRLHVQAGARDD